MPEGYYLQSIIISRGDFLPVSRKPLFSLFPQLPSERSILAETHLLLTFDSHSTKQLKTHDHVQSTCEAKSKC